MLSAELRVLKKECQRQGLADLVDRVGHWEGLLQVVSSTLEVLKDEVHGALQRKDVPQSVIRLLTRVQEMTERSDSDVDC